MLFALGLAIALNAAPAPDVTERPPAVGPKHSLNYQNLLVLGANPLRGDDRFLIGYRYRLYDRGNKFLDGSGIAVNGHFRLSPAIFFAGAMIEVMPLAVLRLRATYSFVQYFATFGYLQSYASPHDDYSPQQIDEEQEAGTNYAGRGGQLELGGLLQAKAWRIAVRNEAIVYYNHMGLRGDDDVFYDVKIDTLVPNDGWSLTNDSDILYLQELAKTRRLTAGVRGTLTKSFFLPASYEPGETAQDPIGHLYRLGPLVAFRFFDDPRRRFNQPTVFVLAQWHLLNPWKTGKVQVDDGMGGNVDRGVSQAVPTVVLGLNFMGDLVAR